MFFDFDFIQMLHSLPSGFAPSHQEGGREDAFSSAAEEETKREKSFSDCLEKADSALSDSRLDEALALYEEARESGGQKGDALFSFATTCYRALVRRGDENKIAFDRDPKERDNELRSLRAKQELILRDMPSLYLARHAKKAFPDALRVEQGEAGFSSSRPLGTDNVQACVCLALHDPETKKTALAHIDVTVREESLDKLIARFGEKKRLQARLFGAKGLDDPNSLDHAAVRALENLSLVGRVLARNDVDLLSADIGDETIPSCAVLDPLSFTFREGYPAAQNPDHLAANGFCFVTDGRMRDLAIVFDADASEERNPLFFNQKALSCFESRFGGLKQDEIFRYLERVFSVSKAALAFSYVQGLSLAHERALQPFFEEIRRAQGFSKGERKGLASLLRKMPLYIGQGSKEANAPLLACLRQVLQERGGLRITAETLAPLYAFRFPDQGSETQKQASSPTPSVPRGGASALLAPAC